VAEERTTVSKLLQRKKETSSYLPHIRPFGIAGLSPAWKIGGVEEAQEGKAAFTLVGGPIRNKTGVHAYRVFKMVREGCVFGCAQLGDPTGLVLQERKTVKRKGEFQMVVAACDCARANLLAPCNGAVHSNAGGGIDMFVDKNPTSP